MRVLIVSHYYAPENLPINYVSRLLAESNDDVEILTGKPNYPEGKFYPGYGFFSKIKDRVDGITVYRLPIIPRGRRFRSIGLTLNYLSFIFSACLLAPFLIRKKQYDYIFIYGTTPLTNALPALFLGSIKKIPVILWVQDLWPESIVAQGFKLPNLFINVIELVVKFIYEKSDLIFCQSTSFQERIVKQFQISENKVKYLPNIIDRLFLESPKKNILPQEILDLKGSFNILFTGNISEAQSLNTVLDSAEILLQNGHTNINYVIVGSGSKLEDLEHQKEKRNITNVFFTGAFPLDHMPSFIRFSDALLILLKDEAIFNLTIPNKLQSYLASGKPIIGSISGEGARIIKNSCGGLVSLPEDSSSLANQSIILSRLNKNELNEFSKNSLKYFQENFSEEVFLNRINKELRSLLKQ